MMTKEQMQLVDGVARRVQRWADDGDGKTPSLSELGALARAWLTMRAPPTSAPAADGAACEALARDIERTQLHYFPTGTPHRGKLTEWAERARRLAQPADGAREGALEAARQRAAVDLLDCILDCDWPGGCTRLTAEGVKVVKPIPVNVCRDHGTRYLRARDACWQAAAARDPRAGGGKGEW